MNNQGQDNWDELISDLGAERAPEPPAEPVNSPTPVVPTSSFDLDNLPPPEPAASGWDSLLDDFGIDAPPAEPTPTPQQPAAQQEPKPAAPIETVREEPARDEIPIEQPAFNESPPESPTPDPPTPDPPTPDPPTPEPPTPEPPTPEPPAAKEPPTPAPQTQPAAQAAPADEAKSSPVLPDLKASLSLPDWFPFAGRRNKAAAAQAQEAAATNDAPQPAELEVQETPQPAGDSIDASTADGAVVDEAVVQTHAELDPEANPTAEGAAEEGEAGDRPPRRRRRRRGGRRRRRSSATAEGEANGRVPTTDGTESTPASQSPASEVAQSTDSQNDDDDDDEISGDSDASDSPRRGGHGDAAAKAIPSWPEAIGVVVDANIAMRGERKSATAGSSRGGRGGSGRGRSRGRRRRKPAEQ